MGLKINSLQILFLIYLLNKYLNVAKRKEKGYVYLLGDWEKEGSYKIGVTRGSLERRMKKLQTGNPGEIYLCSYYETFYPFFLEKTLHLRFAAKRILNEWFALTFEDVNNFKKTCEEIEEMIDILKDNPFFMKNLK